MMLLFLCLILFTITNSTTLPPLFFLPGFSGSELYVSISDASLLSPLPESCITAGIPLNGDRFLARFNATLELKYPECIHYLLTLSFDESTLAFSSRPGVEVSVLGFGEFLGISPVYWPLAERMAKEWGYRIDHNFFGVPYDYRFSSPASLTTINFIGQLQALIEATYSSSNNTPVLLIGHSNGGPTLYSFLSAMTQEWRSKYISAMIGLSGNFLGQMNDLGDFVYAGDKPWSKSEQVCVLTSYLVLFVSPSLRYYYYFFPY